MLSTKLGKGRVGISGGGVVRKTNTVWVNWEYFIIFQKPLTGYFCLTFGLKWDAGLRVDWCGVGPVCFSLNKYGNGPLVYLLGIE